jgi:hypothetical protein
MNHSNFTQLVVNFLQGRPHSEEILAVNAGLAIWSRALSLGIPKNDARILSLRCLSAIMLALKDGEHLESNVCAESWFRIRVRNLLVSYWTEEMLLGRPLDVALQLHNAVAATLADLPQLQRQLVLSRLDGSAAAYAAISQGTGLHVSVVRQAHEQGLATLRRQLASCPELRPVLGQLALVPQSGVKVQPPTNG